MNIQRRFQILALCTLVAATWSSPGAIAAESLMCTVNIMGDSVESLTLIGDFNRESYGPRGQESKKFVRPGKSVEMPPGRYRVQEVVLNGGFRAYNYRWNAQDWFELTAESSHDLYIGAPLLPKVTVDRKGQTLKLSYELIDTAGYSYIRTSQPGLQRNPPRFTASMDGEEIGSGSFEYG